MTKSFTLNSRMMSWVPSLKWVAIRQSTRFFTTCPCYQFKSHSSAWCPILHSSWSTNVLKTTWTGGSNRLNRWRRQPFCTLTRSLAKSTICSLTWAIWTKTSSMLTLWGHLKPTTWQHPRWACSGETQRLLNLFLGMMTVTTLNLSIKTTTTCQLSSKWTSSTCTSIGWREMQTFNFYRH